MTASTVDAAFAVRIFEMLKGFSEYGFPESHAASFALLAYVVVWPSLRERQRAELLHSRLLAVYGKWQNVDGVNTLVAGRLRDLTPLLGRIGTHSRDFM